MSRCISPPSCSSFFGGGGADLDPGRLRKNEDTGNDYNPVKGMTDKRLLIFFDSHASRLTKALDVLRQTGCSSKSGP